MKLLENQKRKDSIDSMLLKTFKGEKISKIANEFNENFSEQVPKLKKRS